MRQHVLRDIRFGLFFGLILFFIVVLPILKLHVQKSAENRKPGEPFTIYIKEI